MTVRQGEMPDVHIWYLRWRDTAAARRALGLLSNIGGTENDLAITRDRILRACFNAIHYNPAQDPGQIYRRSLTLEKKRIAQIVKAAHVLSLSAGRNEKALSWAMTLAEASSGVRITRTEKPIPMATHLVAQKYFSHLESALKGRLPELSGGPWLNRYTIGNLIFDKAISTGRPVTAPTMLAFELSIYLRMHTAGEARSSLQNGTPMPTYISEPCHAVAAAFCNAALNTSFDAKQTSDNLRKLKNVGLGCWPTAS